MLGEALKSFADRARRDHQELSDKKGHFDVEGHVEKSEYYVTTTPSLRGPAALLQLNCVLYA